MLDGNFPGGQFSNATLYMMDGKTRERTLSIMLRSQWFHGLPADLQALVLQNSVVKNATRGRVVMRENRPPEGMYGLLDGQVAITRWVGEDKTFFYYLAGPGFWFGEHAPLARTTTLVSATARTDIRYLFLPIAKLNAIIDSDPNYFRDIAQLTLDRNAMILRSLAQAHVMSPDERLCQRLADFSEMFRQDQIGTQTIELAISQFDLAQMIGCSRQTINALLKGLEARGLISVGFRHVIIHDPDGLRDGGGNSAMESTKQHQ